jgi:hypothetical protein
MSEEQEQEIIFNVKWGKLVLTESDLNDLLSEAISEADDVTSYNEVYDSECSVDLTPKPFAKLVEIIMKHDLEEKISDYENREECMDALFEIMSDDIFEYTEQREIAPSWVERISEERASNHYNPCAGCGGEDCGCCEVHKGY